MRRDCSLGRVGLPTVGHSLRPQRTVYCSCSPAQSSGHAHTRRDGKRVLPDGVGRRGRQLGWLGGAAPGLRRLRLRRTRARLPASFDAWYPIEIWQRPAALCPRRGFLPLEHGPARAARRDGRGGHGRPGVHRAGHGCGQGRQRLWWRLRGHSGGGQLRPLLQHIWPRGGCQHAPSRAAPRRAAPNRKTLRRRGSNAIGLAATPPISHLACSRARGCRSRLTCSQVTTTSPSRLPSIVRVPRRWSTPRRAT